MLKPNLILNSDSYKTSHKFFYPDGTEYVFSYAESRGGKYDATIFFGLQMFIQEYLVNPITQEDIEEADHFCSLHGVPFNREGWEYILSNHDGYLPLEIRAVPEGTLIPVKNAFCTVMNTDPNCAWLTSYIETALLRIWYPITVATRVFNMKKKIKPYFDRTSDVGNMDFALLDFSARGCSSHETNLIGGAAFLISFLGSDSMSAIRYMNDVYGIDMAGFSVPATEHSIMCSYGHDNEFESFKQILLRAPEGGIVSVVSDTWNIFEACKKWNELAYLVRERTLTLVVRPDSGEIWDVLPKVLTILDEGFGSSKNSKGFKVLNDVKVLWGDGINEDSVIEAFKIAEVLGFSADSIMTGSGGGLMQANIDRDVCKFAFKASAVFINGEWKGISKNPITDPGKQSKEGILDLIKVDGKFKTINALDETNKYDVHSEMMQYYYNGDMINTNSLDNIRERINSYL